jgi:hypothetical protein
MKDGSSLELFETCAPPLMGFRKKAHGAFSRKVRKEERVGRDAGVRQFVCTVKPKLRKGGKPFRTTAAGSMAPHQSPSVPVEVSAVREGNNHSFVGRNTSATYVARREWFFENGIGGTTITSRLL